MSKRATMVDIAFAAGVSQATVSLVLNDVPNARVSDDTRARVKNIAEVVGYTRKSRTVGQGARVIGLLIDEVTTTPFATPLFEGARDGAAAQGAIVAIFCTGGEPAMEQAALEVLAQTNLIGVIYASLVTRAVTVPPGLLRQPAVLLNCHAPGNVASVVPGDVTGGFGATQSLIAAGHRRIAHIGGEDWGEAARDRAIGYRRALSSADIPFEAGLLVGPAWTVDSGRDQTLALLDLSDPPTAISCFNDRVAIGCYEALQMRGVQVPRDMSVIGFDNEDLVANLAPPLSTMILPHDEMARWAVTALIEAQGRVWPPVQPQRVKIDCAAILRGSVAAPRKGALSRRFD